MDWITSILLPALLIGAMGLYFYIVRKYGLGRATLLDILIYENQIVYSGSIYHQTRGWGYHTKIVSMDVLTGIRKYKAMLYFAEFRILLIKDGIIWTRPEENNHEHKGEFKPVALDAATLKTLYDKRGIAKFLHFRENETLTDIKHNRRDSSIAFVSNQGSIYPIDRGGGVVPPGSEADTSEFEPRLWNHPYDCIRDSGSDRYQIHRDNKRIGRESFLTPIWIHDVYEQGRLTGLVFCHAQSLDASPFMSISLLTFDGRLVWTLTQQTLALKPKNKEQKRNLSITFAGVSNNLFVYHIHGPRNPDVVTAIRTASGEVAWIRKF